MGGGGGSVVVVVVVVVAFYFSGEEEERRAAGGGGRRRRERVYSLANFLRDHGVPGAWAGSARLHAPGRAQGRHHGALRDGGGAPGCAADAQGPSHWWTRGRDGETALHYLMQNYAASQAVVQAAHAASAQTNAAAPIPASSPPPPR